MSPKPPPPVRRILLFLIGGTLLASGSAPAETLMETYRQAVANDPKLASARLDHQAAEEVVRQARAGLLPTVIADLEKTQERQNILSSQNTVIGAGTTTFPVRQHTLTVTQPIFKKAVWDRLAQTEAGVRQAYANRLAAEQGLMVRVATAYLGVLAARDSLGFAGAEKGAVTKQLQLVEERVARGLAASGALHEARARHAQVSARELEAANVLADAQQGLREMTGSLITHYRGIREDIPLQMPEPAIADRWAETALDQNLAVEAKRQAVEAAQKEIDRQRAGYLPTVNLVGTYNNRKQGGTLFGGGSHVETGDLSLKVSIPIFEGGLTTALTDEAVARYQKSLQDLELERRGTERQARAAYQGVVSSIAQVQALRQGVVSQTSALELKQEGYKAGVATVLAVLDSQRDLYMAKRDYAKARYDYLLYRLRLKQAAGSLSEEDLELVGRLAD